MGSAGRNARAIALGAALVMGALSATVGGRAAGPTCPSPAWSAYGHDASHSFEQEPACTTIDTTSVRTLAPKWVVHTADSVTASPSVDSGTVYIGSWDGTFYAVDATTGAIRWTFAIADDHAVAFGRIVSSAAVATFDATAGPAQKAIIFGGGATLYALDPGGHLLASIELDPRDATTKAAQAGDRPQVEIESSPAVADVVTGEPGSSPERVVYVGTDVHNRAGVGRTGLVSLTLGQDGGGAWRFSPRWKFDAEAAVAYPGEAGLTQGSGTGFGCGGVWSSPAVDATSGMVFFGSASCSYPDEASAAGFTSGETMFAVDAATGALRWRVQPAASAADSHLDDDFGASPNLFRTADGRHLVGEGRKSAQYFARDEASGTGGYTVTVGTPGHVQQDYAIGGFLGSTAVWHRADGAAAAIIGATAVPIPQSPDDIDKATWAVRALDPSDGHVLWTYRLAGPSYGATTVANGVALVPDTFTDTLLALDASSGTPLWTAPMVGPPASAPVAVGDSVYVGAGLRETDAEFKTFGSQVQDAFHGTIGNHPLSPISGIQAFTTRTH